MEKTWKIIIMILAISMVLSACSSEGISKMFGYDGYSEKFESEYHVLSTIDEIELHELKNNVEVSSSEEFIMLFSGKSIECDAKENSTDTILEETDSCSPPFYLGTNKVGLFDYLKVNIEGEYYSLNEIQSVLQLNIIETLFEDLDDLWLIYVIKE